MKTFPIDAVLGIENFNLHQRISARRDMEFNPANRKFCTKEERGEIETDLRRYNTTGKQPKWFN